MVNLCFWSYHEFHRHWFNELWIVNCGIVFPSEFEFASVVSNPHFHQIETTLVQFQSHLGPSLQEVDHEQCESVRWKLALGSATDRRSLPHMTWKLEGTSHTSLTLLRALYLSVALSLSLSLCTHGHHECKHAACTCKQRCPMTQVWLVKITKIYTHYKLRLSRHVRHIYIYIYIYKYICIYIHVICMVYVLPHLRTAYPRVALLC